MKSKLFQECALHFTRWVSTRLGVDEPLYLLGLQKDQNEMILGHYQPSGQWKLRTPVYFGKHPQDPSKVVVRFIFDRSPAFYVVVIIIPSLSLAGMSILTSLLRIESGERVGTGVTLLLALVVELLVVSDLLPASGSNDFPILGKLLLFLICLITLTCISSIFVARIHFKTDPVPKFVTFAISSSWMKFFGLRKLQPQVAPKPDSIRETSAEDVDKSSINKSIEETIQLCNKTLLMHFEKEKDNNGSAWKLFSELLDRLFMTIYAVVFVFGASVFVRELRSDS